MNAQVRNQEEEAVPGFTWKTPWLLLRRLFELSGSRRRYRIFDDYDEAV